MIFDDSWRCCSMHDPSGRRGIWFRFQTNGKFEICAGREGDDAKVTLQVGDTLTYTNLGQLLACLEYGAWMQEEYAQK